MKPRAGDSTADVLDLVVVGAGPAGIAAGLEARARDFQFVIVEQEDDLGGSILHYPRRKLVLTSTVELSGHGRLPASRMGKEQLLAVLKQVVERSELPIRYGCGVQRVSRAADGVFEVHTAKGTLLARHVLLAIGRRGTPQKLGIPGEELSKVAYRLKDPAEYAGTRCLVVGGGDSALEAAIALSAEPGTTVSLAYRGNAIWRAKKENLLKFHEAVQAGRLQLHLNAAPTRIGSQSVNLEVNGQCVELPNDYAFIFAGGVLPKKFLEDAGISMKTVRGESVSVV
jgi:thioredoxin reductase